MPTLNRPQPDIRAIARTVPRSGNLVQGQNEVAISPDLARSLNEVVAGGMNHYSFFEGVDELRRAVAEKLRLHSGVTVDADARPLELIITPGATGGLVTIAHTYLRGAAAVLFESYYPFMDDPEEDLYMRLCFAREDAMLEAAANRIVQALA